MIKFANFDDVLFIAENMRAQDEKEIYATRNDLTATPYMLTVDVMGTENVGMAFVAYNKQGEPVATFGSSEQWPKVWNVFMFATDKFHEVAKEVTKFIKYKLIGIVTNAGAHRGECMSLSTHHVAHKWLKFLGAVQESTATQYGKNGEDFYCFRFLKKVE